MSSDKQNAPDIFVYGTICLDRFLFAGQTEAEAVELPGGEAFNTATVVAGLGIPVTLTGTAIGNDAEGLRLQELLRSHPLAQGIDLSLVPYIPDAVTPVCTIQVNDQGERSMSGRGFAQATAPSLDFLNPRLTRPCVFTVDPNLGAAAIEATQVAAKAGGFIVSMDCVEIPEILAVSGIAVTSTEWIQRILPGMGSEEAARAIARYGAKIAIVTEGRDGGLVFESETNCVWRYMAKTPQSPIRDTTGAGDSFRAGLCLMAMLHFEYGIKYSELIRGSIDFSARLAAVHCTRLGGGSRSSLKEIQDEFSDPIRIITGFFTKQYAS